MTALLKFISNFFQHHLELFRECVYDRFNIKGSFRIVIQYRENTHITGHPAHFPDRIQVELQGQIIRIQKQKMRTKHQIKLIVVKRQIRKLRMHIPPFF